MHYVPTSLGSLHQCGALALWTVALLLTNLARGMKAPNGVNRAIIRQLEKTAAASVKA
jgi:hypothetical protein